MPDFCLPKILVFIHTTLILDRSIHNLEIPLEYLTKVTTPVCRSEDYP